jgi:Lipase (class 3)
VQATYILERDRANKRAGPEALAPAWWRHFKFECIETLKDIYDSSIFGCIYEFKPSHRADPCAPRFVIALRGTMRDIRHIVRDGFSNWCVLVGGLNKRSRVKTAVDSVYKLISMHNTQNIWVSGHSLGASIATAACKQIAKENNLHLKTFLFNPPFPSIPTDSFQSIDSKTRARLHSFRTVLRGGVALFMPNHCCAKYREEFSKLASWTPYLFVNPKDLICASYISYFRRRENMEQNIIEYTERMTTSFSVRGTFGEVFGQGSEMLHLLPSARLVVNLKQLKGMYESHEIQQWWQQDIILESTNHHYKS